MGYVWILGISYFFLPIFKVNQVNIKISLLVVPVYVLVSVFFSEFELEFLKNMNQNHFIFKRAMILACITQYHKQAHTFYLRDYHKQSLNCTGASLQSAGYAGSRAKEVSFAISSSFAYITILIFFLSLNPMIIFI